MFLLKNLVGQFISPIPFCFFVISVGLVFIWFTERQHAGKVIISTGFLVLLLFSYGVGVKHALLLLEKKYPPYRGQGEKFVVVLAGAIISDPSIPKTSWLNSSSISRMVEGIIIYNENPGIKLVFSGKSAASVMGKIAVSIGVDKHNIIIENESKDTNEEARLIREIVGKEKFILVTSASHMPRSMAIFRLYGMNPIPAPTEFLVKEKSLDLFSFFPGSTELKKAERAIHEYAGLLWNKLGGN